jgi:hypothetical protein
MVKGAHQKLANSLRSSEMPALVRLGPRCVRRADELEQGDSAPAKPSFPNVIYTRPHSPASSDT